jgi:hypothetical protein
MCGIVDDSQNTEQCSTERECDKQREIRENHVIGCCLSSELFQEIGVIFSINNECMHCCVISAQGEMMLKLVEGHGAVRLHAVTAVDIL